MRALMQCAHCSRNAAFVVKVPGRRHYFCGADACTRAVNKALGDAPRKIIFSLAGFYASSGRKVVSTLDLRDPAPDGARDE